jgi:hypothetical protein
LAPARDARIAPRDYTAGHAARAALKCRRSPLLAPLNYAAARAALPPSRPGLSAPFFADAAASESDNSQQNNRNDNDWQQLHYD